MTTNTNSAQERTARIDLTQLDKKHVATLTELLICCLSWQPQVCVLGNVRAGDAAEAIQQLLARRSLTSGAPGEPVAEVIEEPAFPGSGIMARDVRLIGSAARPGDKLYLTAPVHDAAAPSAGQLQNDIAQVSEALGLCEPEDQEAFKRIIAQLKGGQ